MLVAALRLRNLIPYTTLSLALFLGATNYRFILSRQPLFTFFFVGINNTCAFYITGYVLNANKLFYDILKENIIICVIVDFCNSVISQVMEALPFHFCCSRNPVRAIVNTGC
jgi:Na+-translocating ferredoxin:NAD+ oxidoreductase RnfA subunit